MAQPPIQEPRVKDVLRGDSAAGTDASSGLDALSRFSDRLTSRYERVGLAHRQAMQPQRGGLLDRLLQPLMVERFVGGLRMLSHVGYGVDAFDQAFDHLRLFSDTESSSAADGFRELAYAGADGALPEPSMFGEQTAGLQGSSSLGEGRVQLEDLRLSPRHLPAISAALREVVTTPDPESMAASYRAQNSEARSWLEGSLGQARSGDAKQALAEQRPSHGRVKDLGSKGSEPNIRLPMASLIGGASAGLDADAASMPGARASRPLPEGLESAVREARPGQAAMLDMDLVSPAADPAPSAWPSPASFAYPQGAEAGALSSERPGPPLERSLATRRALAEIVSRAGLRRLEAAQRDAGRKAGSDELSSTGSGDVGRLSGPSQSDQGRAERSAPLLAQVRALLGSGGASSPESLSQGWALLGRAAQLLGGRISVSGARNEAGGSPTLMRLPVAGTETGPRQADALLEIESLAHAMSRSEAASSYSSSGLGDSAGLPGAVVAAGTAAAGTAAAAQDDELRGSREATAGAQLASESSAPSYFKVSNLGQDLVRRLRQSKSGRRLHELLSEGAIGQAFAMPQVSAGAVASAARAPRGAVPVAGGTGAAGAVAKLDMEILAAMDMWETAFPGRMPYDSGDDVGDGNEEPDFQHAAPTLPSTAPSGGAAPGAAGPEVARIMQDLGLAPTGRGSMSPAKRAARLPTQGGSAELSMSLIRPVMQIIEQSSQPLLKEAVEGSPGTSGAPEDKGVTKADPQKVDYVAHQIVARLQQLIEVEQNRRGF